MKFLIVSDLHGSLQAAEFAIQQFQQVHADYLVLLGDHLYHGPRNPLPERYDPKGVVELLNAHRSSIIALRGNCDSEVDSMVLQFPLHEHFFLMSGTQRVLMTHGHVYNEGTPPPLAGLDMILHGHFHISQIRKVEDRVFASPGSLSLPKMNTPPAYLILEDGRLTLYDTKGHCLDSYPSE